MPFWGSFVAGAAGIWVGIFLQDRERRQQREHTRLEWELETATELFKRVSGTATERIYRMEELRDCIRHEGAPSAQLEEKWHAHRKSQGDWDAALGFNVVQVEQFFGLATSWMLERPDHPAPGERTGIAPQLAALDAKLSDYFHGHDANPERFGPEWHEDFDRKLLELRQNLQDLGRVMMTHLRRAMGTPYIRSSVPEWNALPPDGKP